MRKFLITLLFLFFVQLGAFAADYIPSYVNANVFLGEGFITSSDEISVYKDKDENSEVLAKLNKTVIKSKYNSSVQNVYIASVKDKNLYLLPVRSNEDEWFEVCISQKDKVFGWVKKNDFIDYLSIQDFYNFFGRKNGLYLFRNVSDSYKKLYASPDFNAAVVDTFFYPKHISVWLLAREWMLVKITTYDGQTKTGWLKWKLNDGSVIVFPNLID